MQAAQQQEPPKKAKPKDRRPKLAHASRQGKLTKAAAKEFDVGRFAERLASINFAGHYNEAIANKPHEVRRWMEDRLPGGPTRDELVRWVNQWIEKWPHQDYDDRNDRDIRKLIKDATKYFLYEDEALRWSTIGLASYMTGDVPTLAAAAKYDPKLTIKILNGPKTPTKTVRTLHDDEGLKSLLGEAEGRGQFLATTAEKRKRKGTADLYRTNYNPHTSNKVKPWNKETYRATDIVAANLPHRRDEISGLFLPRDPAIKDQIKRYKDETFGAKPCILIWQRLSGVAGGAHPELDSHPKVLKQIIKLLFKKYPDRKFVLLGDRTDVEADVKHYTTNELNHSKPIDIVALNEFWKDTSAPLKSRKHQNYLISLLSEESDALSIGMRSGSLEAAAILGVNTIYLDDRGSSAAPRMEMFAGEHAAVRDVLAKRYSGEVHARERATRTPLSNYKRVGTRNLLGVSEAEVGSTAGERVAFLNKLLNAIDQYRGNGDHAAGEDSIERSNKDNEINDIARSLQKFQDRPMDFDDQLYRTNEMSQYKTLRSKLEHSKKIFEEKTHYVSPEASNTFREVIKSQIKKSFLTKRELDQIGFLADHLLTQPALSLLSVRDATRAVSSGSKDSTPPFSPTPQPTPKNSSAIAPDFVQLQRFFSEGPPHK